jgi:hypothetical protein
VAPPSSTRRRNLLARRRPAKGDYLCYWYTGTGEAHLVEQARAANAEEAIGWGRDRTSRVRIRTADARSYWAGTTPTPEGFARTWEGPVDAGHPTSDGHPTSGASTC